jgi:aryl-alcohol dehydrogenase-like predicted oxidoreductase
MKVCSVGFWPMEAARRARVRISTKFGIVREAGCYERRIDNSPGYVRVACEASLRRLGVEHIDLYFCHRRDPEVPLEDVVGAMGDLVKAGKVGQIGLSEVSAETLRRAHAVHPVAAVQSEYSCGPGSRRRACWRPALKWVRASSPIAPGARLPDGPPQAG